MKLKKSFKREKRSPIVVLDPPNVTNLVKWSGH